MEALLTALKAVAEPTRLRLISLCSRSDLTVSELTQILGQSQPRISRHLKLLADANVLERFREGAWVFHRLAHSGPMSEIANHLISLLPEDDEQLGRDLEHLGRVRKKRAEAAGAYFSKVAPQWDQVRTMHIEESKVEEALIGLLDHDVKTLLDIGTGTGRMLEVFGPRVERAEGVDLSRDMLAVARVNLEQAGLKNCSVREADMYQLPFQAESFQVAIIHQVLHFADDPLRAIAEAERIMQPGGCLLICDFAPHKMEELRDEHAHRRLGFSDKEVIEWVTEVGLDCGEIIHLPGDPVTVTIWHARKPH
ncbi:MAG: metalloregulator ArsR/SmtB family transcription factor [Rhodospirillales bacterium]|nr:metalloregulator ArsR/SmtB family transcription factor [Rhodospirillales bacterium]